MTAAAASLGQLTREQQMLLMRFVCSFAWADAEVRPQERALVARLARRLGLSDAEVAQVEAWLARPPDPETVDPQRVPPGHRMLFLRALESVITVDGEVDPAERDALIRFAKLAP